MARKRGTLFGKPRSQVVKHPGSFKRAAKKAGRTVAQEARAVLRPGSHASRKMKRKAGLAKAFATMRKRKRMRRGRR